MSMFLTLLFLVFIFYLKFNYASIKGRIGEAFVNKILSKLDPEKYTIFHDLYVPNEEGGTTQLDHIVTSPYGIFVIETKHYEGWIFGKEDQRNWTQVIYKRKEKLYNPIWQNAGHIKALKTNLHTDDDKFYSIIAFSNNSTLKFTEPFRKARVIQFSQLLHVIQEYSTAVYSKQELQSINTAIEKLKIVDKKQKQQVKKEHVTSIKVKKAAQKRMATSSECPKCGSNLVMRKGKFGQFQGCSNYPKCRYTRQVSS
ncbi:MAG: NERD domain-containing protein [Anaerobacillus sp.]|uniref:NERD domain-containing protein n=1 Tax=Anaerobacillus sp. TaxID=1872506 RepID=UPI00391AED4F